MWLEAIGIALGSGVLATCATAPLWAKDEVKRIGRFIKVHFPKLGAKARMRKLSIDMAMHLSADVDMEWWDREFKRLLPVETRGTRLAKRVAARQYEYSDFKFGISHVVNDEILKMQDTIADVKIQGNGMSVSEGRAFRELARDFERWEPGMPDWQRYSLAKKIATAKSGSQVDTAWAAAKAALDGFKRQREALAEARRRRDSPTGLKGPSVQPPRRYAAGGMYSPKSDDVWMTDAEQVSACECGYESVRSYADVLDRTRLVQECSVCKRKRIEKEARDLALDSAAILRSKKLISAAEYEEKVRSIEARKPQDSLARLREIDQRITAITSTWA